MFNKDILLIDGEMSGLDVRKHELIQIAGILLDKKTLKEKKHFSSYIKPKRWAKRDPESMKVNNISWEQLKNAPSARTVLRDLNKKFGRNVILSYYAGIIDISFLQALYKDSGMKYPFDYRVFNIWGFFYGYLAKKNLLNNKKEHPGFNLDDLLQRFKIETPPLHDALVDCRAEAEVLRRIMKELRA